ncbi:hypothetical protein CDL15_Pgr004017 [Punica granatum]|uniref:Uncharacterized protein n=1 Tax=Punica granatum TaxID=22663 RepID=A0A218XFL6_PUNGR|nr:hypothetical protein CDL15_Pgr004017 [Punica granatum]
MKKVAEGGKVINGPLVSGDPIMVTAEEKNQTERKGKEKEEEWEGDGDGLQSCRELPCRWKRGCRRAGRCRGWLNRIAVCREWAQQTLGSCREEERLMEMGVVIS